MKDYHWLPELQNQYALVIENLEKFGSGHIHQTYLIQTNQGKFILQQFNQSVFKNPEAIAENHRLISQKLKGENLPYALSFALPSKSGQLFIKIEDYLFRIMPFIEGTTFDSIHAPKQAFLAAEGFASLIKYTGNIPYQELQSVIPDFHHLGKRFEQFEVALKENTSSKTADVEKLIAFYLGQKDLVREYEKRISDMPLRLTHNDTKINNLIFAKNADKVTGIVDLDTLMPGYSFYDFGDLVRTAACSLDENSQDWENIQLNVANFRALKEGFLAGGKDFFTKEELDALDYGAKMMTYMIGLRFLTDFLQGNVYYAIHYDLQNLHRAKNQMKLLKSIIKEVG